VLYLILLKLKCSIVIFFFLLTSPFDLLFLAFLFFIKKFIQHRIVEYNLSIF